MKKEPTKDEWDLHHQTPGGLLALQKADPAWYEELRAVKYGQIRPSRPVSSAEWDRTFIAGLHPEMKKTDPGYWDSLFAAKFGSAPKVPASNVSELQRKYYELSQSGELLKIKETNPEYYKQLLSAWQADPNPYRSAHSPGADDGMPKYPPGFDQGAAAAAMLAALDDFVTRKPGPKNPKPVLPPVDDGIQIRQPGPKHPKPPLPVDDGEKRFGKYYNGGQPKPQKELEPSLEMLQWEYCRLEKGGGLEEVKKTNPKYYLKMLKAWGTWPNSYRADLKMPVGAKHS